MRKIIIAIGISITVFFIACTTTKSNNSSAPKVSKSGIIPPTASQYDAIKGKYENVTMDELNEGYKIYKGICTDCHRAKNIYKRSDTKWPEIIRVMSKKAKISDSEKEKLTK
ncbi:MAG: hypothetical protein KAZ71_08165, partial [Bacteroidia bacterium]|nr:hypothetical protein [Bacteroidia bacterium]